MPSTWNAGPRDASGQRGAYEAAAEIEHNPLAVARLRGTEPREVAGLGMQPEALELGWDQSATVAAKLDALIEAAAAELRCWGIALQERQVMAIPKERSA